MAKAKNPPTKDWADWSTRFAVEALKKEKFDSAAKGRFLEHYAKYYRKGDGAKAAGVCVLTVNTHIKNDPAFAAAVVECQERWRDRVEAHAWKVAVDGVEEPIIGGEFKDQVVAKKTIYATNILAMMMKRSNSEYREKSELDLNTSGGGVLVVPAMLSAEQWEEQMEKYNAVHDKEPGADE